MFETLHPGTQSDVRYAHRYSPRLTLFASTCMTTPDVVGDSYPPSAFTVPERSPDNPCTGRFHPRSGYIYNLSNSNTFEWIKREDHYSARENNPYFPFIDRDEWELAKFLYTHLTQAQINNFLKLCWVSTDFCGMCCSIMLVGYFKISDQFSHSTGTIIANGCNTQRTGLALHKVRN